MIGAMSWQNLRAITTNTKVVTTKLFYNTGLRQSLLMVFGNAFGQVFSAIALIIITRALGPSRFGEFSVGFALLLILVRVNDLGLTTVIHRFGPQATKQEAINKLFSYTFKLKIITAVSIALIGIATGPTLAKALHFENTTIIVLAFILSSATVLYEQLQAMLQALHRFSQSVVINAIQAVTKFVGAVALMIAVNASGTGTNQGITSLLSSSFLTTATFFWYMLAPALPIVVFKKLFPSWVSLRFLANFSQEKKLVRSLAAHSAIGFLAAGVIENIDILFVQHYLNSYEAGLLGGVSRIALLVSLMGYSLGTVLNPRVAKYQELTHLGQYLKKSWGIVGASLLAFCLFIPFSELVIHWTIGGEYLAGSTILVLLMAGSFLTVAVMPFIALFFSFELPWYFSVSGLLQVAIVVVGNLIFVPLFGLTGAAWVRVTARLALFVFTVALGMWMYQRRKNVLAAETNA